MYGTNYEVPYCEAFSTSHSHSSWAQLFASESYFPITPSLRSSLKVRDHASQPNSTTSNIIVLYNLNFKFLERSERTKSVDILSLIEFCEVEMH